MRQGWMCVDKTWSGHFDNFGNPRSDYTKDLRKDKVEVGIYGYR